MQLASYLNYYVNDYPIFEVNTNTPMGNGLFQKKKSKQGGCGHELFKRSTRIFIFFLLRLEIPKKRKV